MIARIWVVLLSGGWRSIRAGVILTLGGIELAVAVKRLLGFGLWLWARGIQLSSEWLGATVNRCVVKLLGGIKQCRAARHCRGLGGMARGHEHGHYCQAAWQSLWLHSATKLLGGRVQFGEKVCDRCRVRAFFFGV